MPDGMIAGSVTARPPRVCVGIATRGRPQQLTAMLDNLARQTMQPERVIVCCSGPDDVGALHGTANLQIVYEKVGLPRQRNGILRALPEGTDIIVFFDDDFYPDARWIETVAQAFQSDSSINCVTGHVIADGIIGLRASLAMTRPPATGSSRTKAPTAATWPSAARPSRV